MEKEFELKESESEEVVGKEAFFAYVCLSSERERGLEGES